MNVLGGASGIWTGKESTTVSVNVLQSTEMSGKNIL